MARKPRQPQQEDLGDIRKGDRVLDDVTKKLASIRSDKNELIESEKLQVARGLERMKVTGIESYTKNGIELVHTTTDKLRVRLVDDDAASEGGEE